MRKRIDVGYWSILGLIGLTLFVTLFPFVNVLAISFSSEAGVLRHPFMVYPRGFTLASYKVILTHKQLYSAYVNTIVVTVVSSFLGIALTILAGYALSRRDFPARKAFMVYFMITMYISGGLVPTFILIMNLHMYDTLWALIIPGCMSVYNTILMKNFMQSDEVYSLSEAARIDGANEPTILVRIVIPASQAAIATILLFYMVGHWNAFFNSLMYTRSKENWTLQLLLREIVLTAEMAMLDGYDIQDELIPFVNVKAATMLVTVLPILFVYPFVQRYFVKGVMIGALKG